VFSQNVSISPLPPRSAERYKEKNNNPPFLDQKRLPLDISTTILLRNLGWQDAFKGAIHYQIDAIGIASLAPAIGIDRLDLLET
jgi:hypothetical protein